MPNKLGGLMTWEILVWQTKQTTLLYIYMYLIITTNGLNLGRNPISQMFFIC
jgi:hypothetical protein